MSEPSGVTVSLAFVPVISKSAASTFSTSSLKVTRQVRTSALVGDDAGLRRMIDVTRGALVSPTTSVVGALERSSAPPSRSVKRSRTFRVLPASAGATL